MRTGACLVALFLTACGGGGAGTGTRPSPAAGEAPRAPGGDPLAAPWVLRQSGAPVTHTVHVAAVIESRADTATEVLTDTLQSQLTASWSTPSSGFPRRYLGSVQDYRLSRAMGDSLQVPPDVPLPISFTAVQASATQPARFTAPDESSCASAAAVIVQGVRDLWLSMPDTLRPGMSWSDSSALHTCRDSIPLVVSLRREFRVTGAMWRDSAVIVTVERRTAMRLDGAGRQFGDSVSITGEGHGAMMFEVSLATGAPVFGSGESELRLTLRGSRRTQELTQRSRISLLDR